MKKLFLTLVMVLSMVGYVNASALFNVMDSNFSINSSVYYESADGVIEDD